MTSSIRKLACTGGEGLRYTRHSTLKPAKDKTPGWLEQLNLSLNVTARFLQYLAKQLSNTDPLAGDIPLFRYRHLGSMAQVGDWKAIVDFKGIDGSSGVGGSKNGPLLGGFLAFLTWRSAYWTKTVRWATRNICSEMEKMTKGEMTITASAARITAGLGQYNFLMFELQYIHVLNL